jgi:DNA-directed RNA polymerase specialized sigma24 family protein
MSARDQLPATPFAQAHAPLAAVAASIPGDEAIALARWQASRLLGNCDSELVDDVVQESLRRLFRSATRIRFGWQALLSKIVVNTARSAIKRERVRRDRARGATSAAESALDEEPGPAELATKQDLLAKLRVLQRELDGRFGRGTRAIVRWRTKGVEWDKIVRVVKLKQRACQDRYTKAVAWMRKRLSPPEAKGRAP